MLYVLSYKERLVAIEFAALNAVHPQKVIYAYQLEGWDEDWIYTSAQRRFATYTKLSAGQYVFKVKASNVDGSWSDNIKSLKVSVSPPWWASQWAYLFYLLALFGSAWGFYRYHIRALLKRASVLEQNVVERTKTINRLMAQKDRMFANVSHEFKTPLTLILNPLDTLSQNLDAEVYHNKVSMMKRNGQRLLLMVNQLLELSKLDTTQSQSKPHYSLKKT